MLDYSGISTNHQAIVENFKGRSYFFYHNDKLPGGNSYKRAINVGYLDYDDSKQAMKQVAMTTQGVACVP